MHHTTSPVRPQHAALRGAAVAALALLLLASACSSNDPKPDPSLTGSASYALDSKAVLDACAKDLPEDTAIFFALDGEALMNAPKDLKLVPKDWDSSAFEKAIGDFTQKRIGVNIARADWFAVGVAPPGQNNDAFLALVAQGDFAKPTTPLQATDGDRRIYAVNEDDWKLAQLDGTKRVALFLEGSETQWAALHQGTRKPLAGSTNQALLKRVVGRMKSAPIILAMQSSHPAMREEINDMFDGKLPIPQAGSIGLSTQRIMLAIHDTPDRLRAIVSTLTAARDQIKGELSEGIQQVASMDLGEAVVITMAYHLIDPVFSALTPKQDGDMLALSIDSSAAGPAIAASIVPMFMLSAAPMMAPPPMVAPPMPVPVRTPTIKEDSKGTM